MKIGIIAPHSFPIPHESHGGEILIIDLIKSLDEMGHEVSFFAPEKSYIPPHGKLYTMRCSYGKYPPSGEDCEKECFNSHLNILKEQDIVHDHSNNKYIVNSLFNIGYKNILSTLYGGAWSQLTSPHNLITFSKSQRDRAIRGVSDFENTPTPHMDGSIKYPVNDAHVVYAGIDTDFYTPTYDKKSFFLWLNRWNPLRGYRIAIELAKETGIELVLAGTHPDNETIEYHKNCALEAIKLAENIPNIRFEWLPRDPYHHIAKRELYQQAKAYLFIVQAQEPFGLPLAEAAACGTPVIAPKFGSIPEIIEDGKTGYVCDNNIKSFADAILKINTIKQETCREMAVKRFDRDIMAKSYLKEYRSIIKGATW